MWRRILQLAAAISVALGVAMAVLWVRSYYVADTWRWSGSKGELREVALAPGQVRFATAPWCGTGFEYLTSYDDNRDVIWARRWSSSGQTRFGIGFDQYSEPILIQGHQGPRPTDPGFNLSRERELTVHVMTLAFPLLVLVFSTLPLYLVATRLTKLRVRAGFCVGCGYDLRGTPDRCPECGLIAGKLDEG
jgi:hypothetical protein